MADAPLTTHGDFRAAVTDALEYGKKCRDGYNAPARVHFAEMCKRLELALSTPSPPVAAPPATPKGGTLEENVRTLLDGCPHTVRDLSGDYNDQWGVEHLTGSLVLTFMGMQQSLKERAAQPQPQPAQPLTGAQMDAIDRHLTRAYTAGASGEDFDMLAAKADITAPSTPTPPEVAP